MTMNWNVTPGFVPVLKLIRPLLAVVAIVPAVVQQW